jgi:hypothetical protein
VDVVERECRGRCRRVRALVAVATLALLASSWHAGAQVTVPAGELPVPTTLPVLDGGGPDSGGTLPGGSPPTTTPPPAPTANANEQPRTSPTVATGETPTSSARRSTSARPPNAADPAGNATIVERAATDDVPRPAIARLRRSTVPAARQFGFPLGLGLLVLAFLTVQSRLDARDPKLAAAPVSVDDDLLPFL